MHEPFPSSAARPPRRNQRLAPVRAAVLCLLLPWGGARTSGSVQSGSGGPGSGRTTREESPAGLDDLERDLRARRPETRRSAVKQLAAMGAAGERKAWDLVVQALADPDSFVADEAQVALGSVANARVAAGLLGRAGLRAEDPWVRLRVAEALGRLPIGIEAEELARSIPAGGLRESGDVDLARTLLWSIERLAAAKRLGGDRDKAARAAERIARSRSDPELRGAALVALAVLDPLAAHALVLESLGDVEGALRCAALLAVASFPEQECLTASVRALEDGEARVRAQAIENLEKLASRPAMFALVRAMETEERARLRFGILACLRARSGLDLGFDFPAWRSWAETVESRLATGESREVRPEHVPGTRASLAGLTLVSDRVCFLVDFSGSTWDTKVGEEGKERTRKQILDVKLREALEALPEGTRFNLIPYTNEPIPWEKSLVPNTRANVKRAVEWFERCHQMGKGNFHDAAMLALADPGVDTIVALTDGVPTGGHRAHMGLMVELLVERDRYRKVAFDSVLVDAPKGMRRLWEELARRTGGRCTTAELR